MANPCCAATPEILKIRNTQSCFHISLSTTSRLYKIHSLSFGGREFISLSLRSISWLRKSSSFRKRSVKYSPPLSCLCIRLLPPAVRQQLLDAVDGVGRQAPHDVGQPLAGGHAVELAAGEEAVEHGGTLGALVRAGEEVVAPAYGDGADQVLDGVGVDVQPLKPLRCLSGLSASRVGE
jgi:hypothetical protein